MSLPATKLWLKLENWNGKRTHGSSVFSTDDLEVMVMRNGLRTHVYLYLASTIFPLMILYVCPTCNKSLINLFCTWNLSDWTRQFTTRSSSYVLASLFQKATWMYPEPSVNMVLKTSLLVAEALPTWLRHTKTPLISHLRFYKRKTRMKTNVWAKKLIFSICIYKIFFSF